MQNENKVIVIEELCRFGKPNAFCQVIDWQ